MCASHQGVTLHLAELLGALVIEAAFGYPAALLRWAGHPVMWAGALIARLDTTLNRGRYPAGVAACGLIVLAASAPAALIDRWCHPALIAVLMATLPAQRSLWTHVRAVARAATLADARVAVSHIVGRDVSNLDDPGVARAAIESLAESFCDGVVAPALWAALLGLPGIAAYKAVNTADSMIGHRTPRHQAFGWAAARLDDGLNLVPARLSALLIGLAAAWEGADWRYAARAAWRDARRHASPNAGWPEAAMAGALGLRLGGLRVYDGEAEGGAWLGHGRTDATGSDIARALRVYRTACVLHWLGWATVLAALLAWR